jgi:hypothetical protein
MLLQKKTLRKNLYQKINFLKIMLQKYFKIKIFKLISIFHKIILPLKVLVAKAFKTELSNSILYIII